MTANRLVTIYTRALAISGPALVVAVLIADPRWTGQLPEALLMLGATIMLRGAQVSLSKYSYLTQTGLVAQVRIGRGPTTQLEGPHRGTHPIGRRERLALRAAKTAATKPVDHASSRKPRWLPEWHQ